MRLHSPICLAAHSPTSDVSPQENSEWSIPMTSADWNRENPKLVAVGTMDATVAIYDVQAREPPALPHIYLHINSWSQAFLPRLRPRCRFIAAVPWSAALWAL